MSGTFYAVAPLPDTNSRQVAQTIRMPSTALLTIDSEDRYSDYTQALGFPTSPYNFVISKSESMMPGFMTRLGISEVVFPWTIPNITARTQDIEFDYQIGANPALTAQITLPVGFYRPAEIAAFIQTQVATVVPGFTMTYGVYTAGGISSEQPIFEYKTNNVANLIAFAPLAYNTVAYPYPSTTKQLFEVMGFGIGNLATLSDVGRSEFTLAQSVRYVDIVCNQLTNSQSQKDQTSQRVARDMLARIYVGGASGVTSTLNPSDPDFCPPGCAPTVIYRNFAVPKQIQWIPNQNIPGYLQFQVYDDNGELLDDLAYVEPDLFDAADWSMTMLISEN